MTPKTTIVFMGTPEFARIVLAALWEARYPIAAVITQPDKPAGRGQHQHTPECALFAQEKKIPLFQPERIKDESVIRQIESQAPDFIVTAAYGKFLPDAILKAPRIDTLNVHASLLPKFRGAAPINWALINGERTTGVSIMKTVQKMDAGPIYLQKSCPIEKTDTAQTLTVKLAEMGARLLLEALPLIIEKKIRPQDQDEDAATFAPLLKKEDGKINWNEPASRIHNLIRGTNPWPAGHTSIDASTKLSINPEREGASRRVDASTKLSINPEREGASRRVDNKNLKIYDSLVLPEKMAEKPGTIYLISPQGIHVACRDSSLCLTEVQLEGKKRMPAADFARGFRLREGSKFG